MTTIAIDTRGCVAADGLRTMGGELWGHVEKLVVRDGRIYAWTGLFPAFAPVMAWYAEGADVSKLPDKIGDDWVLVVIDGTGVTKVSSQCPYPESPPLPYAAGAGCDYALGAMWVGASAEDAVRAVAERTNHTGGQITVLRISDHVRASNGTDDVADAGGDDGDSGADAQGGEMVLASAAE